MLSINYAWMPIYTYSFKVFLAINLDQVTSLNMQLAIKRMLPVQPNKDEIKNLPVSSSGCKQEYKTNPGVKNPNNKVLTVPRKSFTGLTHQMWSAKQLILGFLREENLVFKVM